MPPDAASVDEPRLVAAFDLLKRTGASEVALRYVPPEGDSEDWPVVWIARGVWNRPPAPRGSVIGAALEAVDALEGLLSAVVDGGVCVRCRRPTGLIPAGDPGEGPLLADVVCWYRYEAGDPPRYRAACE